MRTFIRLRSRLAAVAAGLAAAAAGLLAVAGVYTERHHVPGQP
jgi:predicted transcriptional regulator